MKWIVVCCSLLCFSQMLFSVELTDSLVLQKSDSLFPISLDENSKKVNLNDHLIFSSKYQNCSLRSKVLRGTASSFGYNTLIAVELMLAPTSFTKWDKAHMFKSKVLLDQYKLSFTKPPVFDKDLWVVNYVGHPYQGSIYYNSLRSQGSSIAQSTLFNFGQILLWEYVWEGGIEQPSIQDVIVTPVIGSLIGELAHQATLNMYKNGCTFVEKLVICVINPTFVINNGFRLNRH